MSTIVDVPHC